MKRICVTGTPGTGKTTLAKKLSGKLGFYYFDVNKFIVKNKLYEKYDRKRKTRIVDVNKLNKKIINEIKTLSNKPISGKYNIKNTHYGKKSNKISLKNKNTWKNPKKYAGIIIDSHLSHYLPRKYADLCIVAKCDIKELNKRLKKKKYSKNKIMENIQAEIFDICLNEAKERKHKIISVDTTKHFNINLLAKKLGG
jgi:adenylate kinase